MSFDRTVLASLALAASLAGAFVLIATLSAVADAEGQSDGAGPAALEMRAPGAAIEALASPAARREGDGRTDRDRLARPGHR